MFSVFGGTGTSTGGHLCVCDFTVDPPNQWSIMQYFWKALFASDHVYLREEVRSLLLPAILGMKALLVFVPRRALNSLPNKSLLISSLRFPSLLVLVFADAKYYPNKQWQFCIPPPLRLPSFFSTSRFWRRSSSRRSWRSDTALSPTCRSSVALSITSSVASAAE